MEQEKITMSLRNRLLISLSAIAGSLLVSEAALASTQVSAPGPGILGLVAAGVVGAIAVARSRN